MAINWCASAPSLPILCQIRSSQPRGRGGGVGEDLWASCQQHVKSELDSEVGRLSSRNWKWSNSNDEWNVEDMSCRGLFKISTFGFTVVKVCFVKSKQMTTSRSRKAIWVGFELRLKGERHYDSVVMSVCNDAGQRLNKATGRFTKRQILSNLLL